MLLLIALALGILFLWFFEDRRRCRGMPPGPLRLPFLGNLVQIGYQSTIPSQAMLNLSRKYGEVMHIRLGMIDCVVISSHEAASEFFNTEHGNVKAISIFKFIEARNLGKNYGIIVGNGLIWQNLRRFTLRTLKDFGFGKSASMDVVINEELQKFLVHFEQEISCTGNGVILMENQFELSVLSILWRLVSGTSYEINDEKMLNLLELSTEFVRSASIGDFSLAYPWISDWFPKLTPFELQKTSISNMKMFFKRMVEEQKDLGTYIDDPMCLIDHFLRKIDEGREEEFTMDQLVYVLLDLFQAGSETTSKTVAYAILFMIVHPEIQEKVRREIESVVPPDDIITFDLRGRLPYTQAVIWETWRMANVIPLLQPRECLQETKFRGFTIKKNTPVMINCHAIHMQESIWGPDANSFRPERFIGEDGLVCSNVVEKMVSFGGGKRVCLGQNLAETSSFIYIASLLRKFKFESVGNSKPSILPRLGFTIGPRPFRVRIKKRAT